MNILFYIANGLVMPPAMFFAFNFYKLKCINIPVHVTMHRDIRNAFLIEELL